MSLILNRGIPGHTVGHTKAWGQQRGYYCVCSLMPLPSTILFLLPLQQHSSSLSSSIKSFPSSLVGSLDKLNVRNMQLLKAKCKTGSNTSNGNWIITFQEKNWFRTQDIENTYNNFFPYIFIKLSNIHQEDGEIKCKEIWLQTFHIHRPPSDKLRHLQIRFMELTCSVLTWQETKLVKSRWKGEKYKKAGRKQRMEKFRREAKRFVSERSTWSRSQFPQKFIHWLTNVSMSAMYQALFKALGNSWEQNRQNPWLS